MSGIHDGHRQRLRNKIKRFGFDCLEDHEKLEYLLFPFVPRRDTNPIAHALIDTFGSFKKVLDADLDLLIGIKGLSENAALFLHSLPDVFSSYMTAETELALNNSEQCAKVVIARIGGKPEEHFLVLYLNDAGRIILSETVTSSRGRSVTIDRDRLVTTAIKCRAAYVVIGHNHPSGKLVPSETDIDATNRIVQALGMVGVKLVDHIIVSRFDYFSMRENSQIVEPVSLAGVIDSFGEELIQRAHAIDRIKAPVRRKTE